MRRYYSYGKRVMSTDPKTVPSTLQRRILMDALYARGYPLTRSSEGLPLRTITAMLVRGWVTEDSGTRIRITSAGAQVLGVRHAETYAARHRTSPPEVLPPVPAPAAR